MSKNSLRNVDVERIASIAADVMEGKEKKIYREEVQALAAEFSINR
ncbi:MULTISPECIES: hypothetical protein [Psychrilyobacter]|nr:MULTISPECIES: hypothetical protein [Psychrilyobacter]MCS5422279.1 hypothetical protein [Psychrilyobacter sp. S5]NDI78305.1 hypothetical protein [Psychrilyobacter piezotolerans]